MVLLLHVFNADQNHKIPPETARHRAERVLLQIIFAFIPSQFVPKLIPDGTGLVSDRFELSYSSIKLPKLSKYMLKFTNTLSRQPEEFHPIEEGKVRMYICGPTVWNFAHIGNFRTFIFSDVLRRYLKFKGYQLTHVFNLTDVDDRIINEAAARGITIDEFTAPYIQYFWEDFDALGNERPEVTPRATHHIAEMIDIIAKLLENGHAYESEGSIYYRITAFPDYGKLSKISFEGNIAGGSARIDTDKYDKEDARDFALWKMVGEDEQPGWDAPFGRGRPGWHIECSAMSMKYLGETFDLHAGGIDLQFPHHENEIAQSEGATGKLFAKYWIHSEFLKIDDVTMSKSKGNFFTFRDLREQGYSQPGDAISAAVGAVQQAAQFYFRGAAGRGNDGRAASEFSRAGERLERRRRVGSGSA